MSKATNFFTKHWFSLFAFGCLIISCVYSAILHAEFKKQQARDLQFRAMGSISNMPSYVLSMITMHNLCKEFNKLSEPTNANNRFFNIFYKNMGKYTQDRANFAGSVAIARFYFNDEINKKLNSLLDLERHYGDTPQQYCSNQLLSSEELFKKQDEILKLAYQQYGMEY